MADIIRRVTQLSFGSDPNNAEGRYIIRVPGLGRPKFAQFFLSRVTEYDEPADQAQLSVGFWADTGDFATGQSCAAQIVGDNGSVQQVRRLFLEGQAAAVLQEVSGGTQRYVKVTGVIDDGLEIQYGDQDDYSRYLCTVVLWAGDDLEVDLQHVTLTAGVDTAQGVDGVGFKPTLQFFLSASKTTDTLIATDGGWSYGCVWNNADTPVNRCITWGADHGAGTTRVSSALRDNRCLSLRDGDGTSVNFGAEVTAYHVDDDGFDITPRDGTTGTERLTAVSLNTGDLPLLLETFSTPTDDPAGETLYENLGSRPQGVELATTLCDVANTVETGSDAEHVGIAAWDDIAGYHHAVECQDNATASTAVTNSLLSDRTILCRRADGSGTAIEALLSEPGDRFTDDGYKLTFTDNETTARLGWALVVGQAEPITGMDRMTSHLRHRIGVVNDWWDVTNPPEHTMLPPMSNWEQYPSGKALNAQISYFTSRDRMPVFVVPPGEYLIEEQVELQAREGFYMLGAGAARSVSPTGRRQAGTRLTWIGGTTGPMFKFDRTPGLRVQGITFSAGKVALDELVQMTQDVAGIGQLFLEFDGCAFFSDNVDSPIKLFRQTTGGATSADVYFKHCMFRTLDVDDAGNRINFGTVGFYTDSLFGVNNMFTHCEFGDLGTCIHSNGGGRTVVDVPICGNFHTFYKDSNPISNHAGVTIRNMHVDGGDGHQYRKKLYHAAGSVGIYGNVVLDNVSINAATTGDHYKVVSAISGNEITLSGALRVTVGDRLIFVDPGDRKTIKVEATVDSAAGDGLTYEVTAISGSLANVTVGVDECTWGEPLVDLYASTEFHWRGGYINGTILVDAKRLVHLRTGTVGGFDHVPYFLADNLGLHTPNDRAIDLFNDYVKVTGSPTPRWRFRDCGRLAMSTGSSRRRYNISNVEPYTNVSSTPPSASDNVAAGWPLGSTWQSGPRIYEQVADGIWIDRSVPPRAAF